MKYPTKYIASFLVADTMKRGDKNVRKIAEAIILNVLTVAVNRSMFKRLTRSWHEHNLLKQRSVVQVLFESSPQLRDLFVPVYGRGFLS